MSEPTRPSFGERLLGAFLALMRALAKALVVVLILGGVAAAAYYGLPYVYRRYLQPVEETQAAVQRLEDQTERRFQELDRRLRALEEEDAQRRGRLDALEERLEQMQARLEGLQEQMAAQQSELRQITALQRQLSELESQMEALDAALQEAQNQNQQIQAQVAALAVPVDQIHRYLKILQAMEHLTRARLFLDQSNYGLAKSEVQYAQDIVVALQSTAPPEGAETYQELADRLQRAAQRLPARPLLAAQDLEVAWELLGRLLPVPPTPEATPAATEAPEGTPAPTPTATPTP